MHLGLDKGTAEQILTINDNNLERAINYHLEGHNDDPTPTLPGPSNHFYSSLPNMPSLGGYDESNERLPVAGTSTATLPDEDCVRAPIPPKRGKVVRIVKNPQKNLIFFFCKIFQRRSIDSTGRG